VVTICEAEVVSPGTSPRISDVSPRSPSIERVAGTASDSNRVRERMFCTWRCQYFGKRRFTF
jgi:hypothetical protein